MERACAPSNTAMPEDLYELLGVTRDADVAALKRAFRTRVKELHPDKNPGSARHEARFKAVSRAYAVLTNPAERAAYDQKAPRSTRASATRVAKVRVEPSTRETEPLRGPTNGLEMLESFFRKKRPTHEPGEDRHATVTIPLGDALRGSTLDLEGLERKALRVEIPRGTVDGDRVRLLGRGMPSPTLGPDGDLWLEVRVEPHPHFRVEGRDLHLDLPITVPEAYLGCAVAVPTPTGAIELRVPPRTTGGAVLRVKDRGVPAAKGEPAGRHGALFVHVQVVWPSEDVAEVTTLVRRLAEIVPSPRRDPIKL